MDYKKLYTGQFVLEDRKKSKDELEWSHYDFPRVIKDYYQIEHIDVSHVEPFPVAITAGSKVLVCETETSIPESKISRFQKKAYGAKFRKDGKLLAVGSEQNVVKLFDYKKKSLLRIFTGHTSPVHRVDFITGRPEMASFSDDKSVIIWDIATEAVKQQFSGHMDIIRAGVASPISENMVISGSYDHTVKIWDCRIQSCVKTFSQESIVEALLFFPTGACIASAGVSDLRIWDLVAGKSIKVFANHHKSITSLAYVTKTNTLLSGSLDKHVKIYSMSKMKYLHTLSYPAPILSLGVTDIASTLVVGMSSGDTGLISFQYANKERKACLLAEERNKRVTYKEKQKKKLTKKYASEGTGQLKKCEAYMKQFDYTRALNALSHTESHKQPQNVVAVYQKLIQLRVLRDVLPVCKRNVIQFATEFVIKYICVENYSSTLEVVAQILMEWLKSIEHRGETCYNLIDRLKTKVVDHKAKMVELAACKSLAEMFLSTKIVTRANSRAESIELQEKEVPLIIAKPVIKKAIFDVPE